jgi:hypothetical protein
VQFLNELRRGTAEQPFKHLDAAPLVDARLRSPAQPQLPGLWAPLVYAAGEAALDGLLVATLRAGTRDPALSPRRGKNLVERLKELRLSAEDVRKLLR